MGNKSRQESMHGRRIYISEAARMMGVSADTLRRWDASGRFVAKRTPGGTRWYSADDMDRLAGVMRNPADAVSDAVGKIHELLDDIVRVMAEMEDDRHKG